MKRLTIISLILALCASACETAGSLEQAAGGGSTATAAIEENDGSKAYLSPQAYHFLWAAGDEISVVTGTENKKFVLTSGADKSFASFYCPGDIATGGHFAVYPYNSVCAAYSSVLTISYPEILPYDAAHSSAGPNTMIAYRASDLNFTFSNACSIIRFALFGSARLSAMEISSIEGAPLCGEAVAEFKSDGKPVITMTGSTPKVRIEFGTEGLQLSNEVRYLDVSLPPAGLKKGISVLLIGENGWSTVCKTISMATLSRNSILEMTPLSVKYDSFIDLSAKCSAEASLPMTCTANCYVIDAPGRYKFPCTVKGNSLKSVGVPAKAAVVWETFGTATAPAKGSIVKSNATIKDGYLLFETPETFSEGNALLAVKDAQDNIIWSWHIWATSEKMKTYSFNGYNITDRNLGALAAGSGAGIKAFGLLYQWGRKDPFYGSAALTSTAVAACSGTAVRAVAKSNITGTLEYVTAHPADYINSDNADWMYESDDDLWNEEKTLYDPCPPGYCVPGKSWTGGISSSAMTWSGSAAAGYGRQHNASGFWFPAAGKYSYHSASGDLKATINQVGAQGRYWSATPNEGNGNAYGLGFASSSLSAANAYNRICAYNVRCAKEQ